MAQKTYDPWDWARGFGFSHGVEIGRPERMLEVSGQCATGPDGSPLHPGDMRAQMALAVANIEAVLSDAGLGPADVVRIRVFSTDVGATLDAWDAVIGRFNAADCRPAATLVGVTALFHPDLMVEIEATAVA